MAGKENGLTAGIIIVGDELLKGHVQDANSHYLCRQLWMLGVKVCQIAVVSDDMDSIAEEVKRFSSRYDYVLTAGGVGPTHDDVTVEAVGKAFGEGVYLNKQIMKMLFGDENAVTDNAYKKMAMVPTSTQVHLRPPSATGFSFLLYAIHNVHCYPGVPSLLKEVFQSYKDLYSKSGKKFFLKEVFFSCDEDVLAASLADMQKDFPQVQVGSYPELSSQASHSVKVALESDSRELVEKAFARLVLLFPTSVMMSARDHYGDEAAQASKKFRKSISWFLDRLPSNRASLVPDDLCQKIAESLETLEKAIQQYSHDELCVAFNGGKDCTVTLALFHAILKKKNDFSAKLKSLYVNQHTAFPQVEEFVAQAEKSYSLDMIRISGTILEALTSLKDSDTSVKAVLTGTRRTDPYSSDLEAFSPTDSSWPDYMRVNCILDWSYTHIWLFLKLFEIPYCKLYDQGYTSLDGMDDTFPNPALLVSKTPTQTPSSHKMKKYLPAYLLRDEELERAGRGHASDKD